MGLNNGWCLLFLFVLTIPATPPPLRHENDNGKTENDNYFTTGLIYQLETFRLWVITHPFSIYTEHNDMRRILVILTEHNRILSTKETNRAILEYEHKLKIYSVSRQLIVDLEYQQINRMYK